MSVRRVGVLLAAIAIGVGTGVAGLHGQDAQEEKIMLRAMSKVQPAYPELARRLNISGTVKVKVVVAPNGTVKDAKLLGGHPVLAAAALDAAKRWRFEPTATETTGVVEFKFEPHR